MYYVLLVVFTIVAILLILSVLLQRSKGDVGSAFGGMGQSVFGPEGVDTILTKITFWLGMSLIFLAMLMALLHPSKRGSLIGDEGKGVSQTQQTRPSESTNPSGSPSQGKTQ